MITIMRGCVAHNDLWTWPISSRSFGLDLENRVRSVASTVQDGFFLYLAQMITTIRGCVACYFFFRIWKFEFLANFWNFSALTLKKKSTVLDGFFPYVAQMITSMRGCVAYNYLWPWPISSRSFGIWPWKSCPLCSIYSSGWILSILATNNHYHERVCGTQWPLTLTYIFKVIRPWLRKSCPLCSIYRSGWILFIFGTNDHYH